MLETDNMKRIRLCFQILLVNVVIISTTYATWSRVSSLGIPFWMIEEDDTLLWMNPERVSNYPNQIWGELGNVGGTGTTPNVNANLSFGNQWGGISAKTDFVYPAVISIFFARPYWGLINSAGQQTVGSDVSSVPNSPLGNSMLSLPLNNKLDIFWSSKISGYPLGISLFFASNSSSVDSIATSQPSVTINDIKYKQDLFSSEIWLMLGTRLQELFVFKNCDLVLNLGLHKIDNKYIDEQYNGIKFVVNDDYSFKTKGFATVELTARSVNKMSEKVSLITLFDYFWTDLSNKFVRKTDTNNNGEILVTDNDVYYQRIQSYITSYLTLGTAANIYFNKLLCIVGFNMLVNNLSVEEKREQLFVDRKGVDQEYKYERLLLNLPLYLAAEYNVSKLLTLRAGVNKVVYGMEYTKVFDTDYGNWDGTKFPITNIIETKTVTDKTSDYTTNISVGIKIKLSNNFWCDIVVRQNVLFTGTYVLSGVPETLFSQITAVYKF